MKVTHPFRLAIVMGFMAGAIIVYVMMPHTTTQTVQRIPHQTAMVSISSKPVNLQFYRELSLPPKRLPTHQATPVEQVLNDEGNQPKVLPSSGQDKLLESIRRVLGSEAAGSIQPSQSLQDEESDKP